METTTLPATQSAGEAAKAEHARIATDSTHPMFAGYRRGDSQVMTYLDEMYRKAYPAPATDERALTPEAHAAIDVDAQLRTTLGEQYNATMELMHTGAARLFSSSEHVKALDLFLPILTELGPAGEVAGIKFLAEIGRLHNNHTGGI